MDELLPPGTRVRTRVGDRPGHTRLPRYARGMIGTIVEHAGDHPLPDERAAGLDSAARPVYVVRFAARDLWGSGDHDVSVELWRDYLERVDVRAQPA